MNDLISREVAIDAIDKLVDRFERILSDIRETNEDESVCGLCEYGGTFIGQSGNWCNECPGFDKADCFKLSDERRKNWLNELDLPSAQPERIRGRWEIYIISMLDGEGCKCSECGFEGTPYWDFCPNCGADMRRGKNDSD